MHGFSVPRRWRLASLLAISIVAIVAAMSGSASGAGTGAASQASYSGEDEPLCVQRPQLCVEKVNPWSYDGDTYVSGHDEPSLLFYSNRRGSGNSNEYRITLPTDPATPPKDDGTGSVWNFQQRVTFWFGMAMCDDQSAPNPGEIGRAHV